ncbi:hypothetical protein N825_31895 [Skermanella stibiiresistens SB22]|uniref:Lipoprotein n=2 Tax=Skermanella TaxID=204447 RepID=W9GUB8_9PROT|nr:hypothetical protein N825_31895 [Skermanella stibiiresistens SB22]
MITMPKLIRTALVGLSLLALSACVNPPAKRDFSAMRAHHPRSIVIVPVTNSSTQVDAADNFLVTLPVPLAEKGYYVFPVHMVKRVMEDEGLADADLVHSADARKVAALFGADAVLFANIQRWDSQYAILATTTTVNIGYTLKSGTTGQTLWQDNLETVYSPQAQNSGGHPLAMLVTQLVVAAMERAAPSYLPLANQANTVAFYGAGHGIPSGPYDQRFGKDY